MRAYRKIATLAHSASGVRVKLTSVRIAARIVAVAWQAAIALFALFEKHVAAFWSVNQAEIDDTLFSHNVR